MKFTSSPLNRYSIHHGQSLAYTCAFLEAVCRDRHCIHHSGTICLYVCYKKTWHNKTSALLEVVEKSNLLSWLQGRIEKRKI